MIFARAARSPNGRCARCGAPRGARRSSSSSPSTAEPSARCCSPTNCVRDTPRAIRMLREAGIARIVMVTGDRAAAAQAIGAALDLDAVLADRVPSDKVDAVRSEQRLASDHHGRRRHQRCAGAGSRPTSASRWARAAPAPRRRRPMS